MLVRILGPGTHNTTVGTHSDTQEVSMLWIQDFTSWPEYSTFWNSI